ncbi:hypothetical protein JX265_003109 [Neoarthrinium moseri]|uniref:Uncharacterized protein n=1 Tax=Neoarthrinium moseri TaxID=1658444 RepID=A0A9P9WTP0_9PEZI|nr:hypothetical protein JX265_003109 [Neoarthrinium moseri]
MDFAHAEARRLAQTFDEMHFADATTIALLAPIAVLAAPPIERDVDHHKFKFEDFKGQLDANGKKVSQRSSSDEDILKRNNDYVSSCGSEWVSVGDFVNGRYWLGYSSAVDAFCTHITTDYDGEAAVIGPKAYAGTTIRTNDLGDQIGLSGGKNPTDKNTQVLPGHIEFEIHNKQDTGDHTPDLANCKLYLKKMADPNANGKNCYGKNNKDSKGGTWQIGNDKISYHALPGKN